MTKPQINYRYFHSSLFFHCCGSRVQRTSRPWDPSSPAGRFLLPPSHHFLESRDTHSSWRQLHNNRRIQLQCHPISLTRGRIELWCHPINPGEAESSCDAAQSWSFWSTSWPSVPCNMSFELMVPSPPNDSAWTRSYKSEAAVWERRRNVQAVAAPAREVGTPAERRVCSSGEQISSTGLPIAPLFFSPKEIFLS